LLQKTLGFLKQQLGDTDSEDFIKIGKDGLQENFHENTEEFKQINDHKNLTNTIQYFEMMASQLQKKQKF